MIDHSTTHSIGKTPPPTRPPAADIHGGDIHGGDIPATPHVDHFHDAAEKLRDARGRLLEVLTDLHELDTLDAGDDSIGETVEHDIMLLGLAAKSLRAVLQRIERQGGGK